MDVDPDATMASSFVCSGPGLTAPAQEPRNRANTAHQRLATEPSALRDLRKVRCARSRKRLIRGNYMRRGDAKRSAPPKSAKRRATASLDLPPRTSGPRRGRLVLLHRDCNEQVTCLCGRFGRQLQPSCRPADHGSKRDPLPRSPGRSRPPPVHVSRGRRRCGRASRRRTADMRARLLRSAVNVFLQSYRPDGPTR